MSINITSIVHIDTVSFAYNGESVLEHIQLDIHKGEFLGIIGPNGSGKTTLIKIILGILVPTNGTVQLFGENVTNFSQWSKIGYVHQRAGGAFSQFPITAGEIVDMARVHGSRNRVDEALAAVDMTEERHRQLRFLSGGQQQRIFIARALVNNPQLLILDEPTVGVDAKSQALFYQLLKKLNTKNQLTLILVSHDIDVIAHEVSTVACINRTLISHGPPKDIMRGNFLKKLYGENIRFIVHGH